jgi:hypothetical protein
MAILVNRFPGIICHGCMLISVLAFVSAACAETLPAKVVTLLRDACVIPDTPGAMMDKGEEFAAMRGWERREIPETQPSTDAWGVTIDEWGASRWIRRGWEFDLPELLGVKSKIEMTVGGEIPFRFAACVIQLPIGEFHEELATELQEQFGSSIVAKRNNSKIEMNVREWLFFGKPAEDCEKKIAVSPGEDGETKRKFTVIVYFIKYQNKTDGPLVSMKCGFSRD